MIVAQGEGMLYLAPLVALLGGALLVFSNARYGRLLALLSVAAAFLFTVGIVARPGTLLLSGSEETGLLLYAGGPGLIFALLVTFVILVSIRARFSGREEAPVLASTLLLAAGGLIFLLSHNPLTLYLGWGLLDLSILFALAQGASPRTATRAMIINFTASLALLFSLLGAASWEGSPMSPQLLALLIVLASWVRWGLYPVQMVHIAAEEIPFLSGSALQTVTLATGGYFLTLYEWPRLEGVPRAVLLLLAGLALLYGALSTWRNPTGIRREKRLCLYLAQSQMGLLALGLLAGDTGGGQAVLLLTVSLILALSVLRVGMEAPRQRLVVKVALGVGVASLCGLPLTAGFAARWLIYDSLLRQGEGLIVGLGALSSALIVAPLLGLFITRGPDRGRQGRGGWASVATLWLLVFPLVILGLYPQIALVRPEAISESFPSLAQLWGAPSSLPIWAAIVLPLLLGYLAFSQRDTFVRFQERLLHRAGPFWERFSFPIPQGSRGTGILSYLDLEGLYGALERVGAKVCSGLRGVVMVVEGGSLGWLLLLAFIVGLFLWRG
ncbi:MAG: proton-conducting transporter membrane subunit [Anaerolineae bacterium]